MTTMTAVGVTEQLVELLKRKGEKTDPFAETQAKIRNHILANREDGLRWCSYTENAYRLVVGVECSGVEDNIGSRHWEDALRCEGNCGARCVWYDKFHADPRISPELKTKFSEMGMSQERALELVKARYATHDEYVRDLRTMPEQVLVMIGYGAHYTHRFNRLMDELGIGT